jgi:hypothetical protein
VIRKFKRAVAMLALGAAPLATTVQCDPRTGGFFVDRFDFDVSGSGFFDVVVSDPYYYDDCCYGGPYYDDGYYVEETIIIDDGYYY